MTRRCTHKGAMGMFEALTRVQQLRRDDSPGSTGIKAHWCWRCRGWYLSPKSRVKILVNALTRR